MMTTEEYEQLNQKWKLFQLFFFAHATAAVRRVK